MALVLRPIAIIALTLIYSLVYLISLIRPAWRNRSFKRKGEILVIGTFHNPNWFQSHIVPLSRCGAGKVVLVCDTPVFDVENIVYVCPSRIVNRLFTRAGAKLIYAFMVALRSRPDMFMGYHIFPGAISALVLGSIFNRPSCYQDTSGPLELSGGGWNAENRLLVALGSPSKLVEKCAFAVVRQFDMIVVRGNTAKAYIQQTGYTKQLTIITGSIDIQDEWNPWQSRDVDMIFVGRLIKAKNPAIFLKVVEQIKKQLPEIKAVLVGDGPDMDVLTEYCHTHDLTNNVEILGQRNDVMDWYRRAKVFVLPTAWEGLSIAMIEAMASGSVPIVSNVGDLKDLVNHSNNGYLVDDIKHENFTRFANELLQDKDKWQNLSTSCRERALAYSGLDAIAAKWQEQIEILTSVQTVN